MALEVTGKLIKILPAQTGSGARGNWVKQEFVIETMDQYPKKICLSLWGDKADSLGRYSLNDEIKVSFNVESREYNERWYTDLRAWKIEPGAGGSQTASGQKAKGSPSPEDSFNLSASEEDDLPF